MHSPLYHPAPPPRRRLCLAVVLAVAAIVAPFAVVTAGGFAPDWLTGRPPNRPFVGALNGDLLPDYGGVVAVAHNAGDRLRTTRQALAYGAHLVEIDVVSMGGQLYAGHASPPPVIGRLTFQGPRLAAVWAEAAGGGGIVLNLKERGPDFLELVFDFLDDRQDSSAVFLVHGDPATHRAFRERAPKVRRILGVSPPGRLATLQADPALIELVDGVVLRHHLLAEETAAWLESRGLMTFVYTVDDLPRLNRLVALGVDAVITDNLAIVQLLDPDRDGARVSTLFDRSGLGSPTRQPGDMVALPTRVERARTHPGRRRTGAHQRG